MQSGKCFSGPPGKCWSTGAQIRLFLGGPQDSYSAGPPHRLLTSFFQPLHAHLAPGPTGALEHRADYLGDPKTPILHGNLANCLPCSFQPLRAHPTPATAGALGHRADYFGGSQDSYSGRPPRRLFTFLSSPYVPTRPLVLLELWNTEQTVLGDPKTPILEAAHRVLASFFLAHSYPLNSCNWPSHSKTVSLMQPPVTLLQSSWP